MDGYVTKKLKKIRTTLEKFNSIPEDLMKDLSMAIERNSEIDSFIDKAADIRQSRS